MFLLAGRYAVAVVTVIPGAIPKDQQIRGLNHPDTEIQHVLCKLNPNSPIEAPRWLDLQVPFVFFRFLYFIFHAIPLLSISCFSSFQLRPLTECQFVVDLTPRASSI